MKKILIFRFSALGDIAIGLPLLQKLAENYPEKNFVFFTDPFFNDISHLLPKNLEIIGIDLKKKYQGFFGIFKLFLEIKKNYTIEAIVDLHDVIRSKIIRFLFGFFDFPITCIDKERKQKNALTRKKNKIFEPLTPQIIKYQKAFEKLDLPIKDFSQKKDFSQLQNHTKTIGIAPFSRHQGKNYPLEKIEKIIENLEKENWKIIIFGSQADEKKLKNLQKKYPKIEFFLGQNCLKIIEKMKTLNLFLSMDSLNMHLANWIEIPVVSIWGATHSYLGFYPWGQDENYKIEKKLFCRPCSSFGQKKCYRKDFPYECLDINEEIVLKKIKEILIQTNFC